MNSELGEEGCADPLDRHLDRLRECLPVKVEILGGVSDPRSRSGSMCR
ncbi:hypothetical protein AB0I28_04035 [Phytomonospora sp. NPDC050363]